MLFPGQTPAHDAKCAGVGKRVMSTPISAMMHSAARLPTPTMVSDSALEAAGYQRQISREQAAVALGNLKKAGMQVSEINAAELAKFRAKIKPVIEKHSAIVGADTVRALQAELARLRK